MRLLFYNMACVMYFPLCGGRGPVLAESIGAAFTLLVNHGEQE